MPKEETTNTNKNDKKDATATTKAKETTTSTKTPTSKATKKTAAPSTSKKEIDTTKFAIIQTGGKQYKVNEGSIIDIELLSTEIGKKVDFKEVLLIHSDKENHIGAPFIENASVTGTVLNHIKSPKTLVFKFKRKTGYKKTQGHRQNMTTVKIDKI